MWQFKYKTPQLWALHAICSEFGLCGKSWESVKKTDLDGHDFKGFFTKVILLINMFEACLIGEKMYLRTRQKLMPPPPPKKKNHENFVKCWQ